MSSDVGSAKARQFQARAHLAAYWTAIQDQPIHTPYLDAFIASRKLSLCYFQAGALLPSLLLPTLPARALLPLPPDDTSAAPVPCSLAAYELYSLRLVPNTCVQT